MWLREIVQQLDVVSVSGPLNRDVKGIDNDSRRVGPQDIFVAIHGGTTDGRRFAQTLSCAAVIAEGPVEAQPGVTTIEVADARLALAQASAAVYGHPSAHLPVIGLTGTNGKTTTAWLLEAIAQACGLPSCVIGTTGHRIAGRHVPAQHTTPESPVLQRLLSAARDEGCGLAAMEVSSIGLDLRRVDAVQFRVGGFTSFSQDHLDHHGSMEAYLAAKMRLLEELVDPDGVAVLHDSLPASVLRANLGGRRTIVVGQEAESDLRVVAPSYGLSGTSARLEWQGVTQTLHLPLVGAHNLDNALTAAGCALALGLPLDGILRGLAEAPDIPGRLQRVPSTAAFHTFVDYAHTPDALQRVLETLKPLTSGRLTVIFGCGGDRDRTKRPLMGRVASITADQVILTSDNPRSEDPNVIISDIRAGIDGDVLTEPDRQRAIELAVRNAADGDVILIAGKGHETHQTIGNTSLPFHDVSVAAASLAAWSSR